MGEDTVSAVIRDMLNKEETPQAILGKMTRFSISLTNLQNKRLEILSSKVSLSKQEFISKVIEAAMLELETQLKLIDQVSIDILGQRTHGYTGKYVREILQSLGISEDDWDAMTLV